jgi:hypothetical protein
MIMILGITIWYFYGYPSIEPKEVEVNAIAYKSETLQKKKFNTIWVLDVELVNKSDTPLFDLKDNNYAHIVTPFINGFNIIGWEPLTNAENSKDKFVINSYSEVEKMLNNKLKEYGFNPISGQINQGFTYKGDEKQVKIRYYISPISQVDNNNSPSEK